MKHLKFILALIIALATFPMIGSSSEGHNEDAALGQGLCPIMEENSVNPSLYTDYQGERVFFCCEPCVDVFNQNPEKYLKNLAQFAATTAPQQTTCPVMEGNPIDPVLYVDYQGERIYLCCKTCVKLFTENPEGYLQNLPQFTKETEAHSHETDHAAPANTSKLIPFIGKFHPVAIHLPIALILGAALAELLFLFTGVPLFRSAARFNLLIAVLGAAVAVPLGLAAASGTQYPADYAAILFRHKLFGFATLAFTLLAVALSERLHRKGTGTGSYRVSLLVCALLVGATGHLGGLLVFGLNHFSW